MSESYKSVCFFITQDSWLENNKLNGEIPKEIENLKTLTFLYILLKLIDRSLSGNKLKGSIPSEIGNLEKLQML